MKRQYDLGMGVGKYGYGIIKPIKIKNQDMTSGLGFKPKKKDFQSYVCTKTRKKSSRSAGQTKKTPLKIAHFSETFQLLAALTQP